MISMVMLVPILIMVVATVVLVATMVDLVVAVVLVALKISLNPSLVAVVAVRLIQTHRAKGQIYNMR